MELDGYQKEAVDSDRSMMVIAGPGSGKTRVLTEKARKIFNSGKSILCLTFTRAAAKEMGDRVSGIPACTIHSYCCGRVGWNEEWGYPGLLYRYLQEEDQDKYDWVLVDEVQDLNEMEMDVVLSLIGDKVFAVGDPYQSIYGFQGALGPYVPNIFKRLGCKQWDLKFNYRSCPEIVENLNWWYNRGLISSNVKENGLTFVLCRTNDDVFFVSRELKNIKIPHVVRLSREHGDTRETQYIGESNIKVMTIHQSKGLEADRVLLFGWHPENWMGEEERRVFYVGMSRASKVFKEVDSIRELVEELL